MTITKEIFRKKFRQRYGELSEKNPRYSLRAFANKINLSPSILSRFINGKRNLSLETMIRISQILDLDLSEFESDLRMPDVLGIETFKVIADWYHFPLVELMRTKSFKSDEKWIARRMGLPLPVVQAALDRLENLKLIERKSGELIPRSNSFLKSTEDISSLAIRKHHKQMMDKAHEALDESPQSREFRALNLSFNPEDLDEAKKMIRDFYKKFNRRFSKDKGKEIYQLNLQFFKLTRGNE